MDLFRDLNIEYYQNIKLTLPNVPSEYIQLTFIDENLVLKYDCVLPFGQSCLFESTLIEPQILAKAEDIKTVYEFKLDIQLSANDNLEYLPGDTIGVLPENCNNDVRYIIDRLGLTLADQPFQLEIAKNTQKKKASLPNFIPKVYTMRKVLTECLDFKSVPKKLFLRSLSDYTSDEHEKLILNILSSSEGKSEYDKYVVANKTNILRLLKTFKSCEPPFTVLLEHLPRLMPRPYSIASSPLQNPNRITIVFSKLNSPDVLTTTYLENIIMRNDRDTKIRFYFRQNLKRFQYSDVHLDRNVIMISFGTGLAPFIGFLDHRRELMRRVNKPSYPITWLLTGHRYAERNNLYIEKICSYRSEAILTELFQAFSRDSDANYNYVQDIMNGPHRSDFIRLFLDENTLLYVCGDGNRILPDVKNVIVNCIREECKVDEMVANDIVKDKIKKFEYLEDIWI